MLWVTHSHLNVGQVACAWLIQRFVDSEAEFMFVAGSKVQQAAEENEGMPFEVPDVDLGSNSEHTAFAAIMNRYELDDPGLQELARVVRAAGSTNGAGKNPVSLGLDALASGYSMRFPDNEENLANQFEVYDSLYAWCRLQAAKG